MPWRALQTYPERKEDPMSESSGDHPNFGSTSKTFKVCRNGRKVELTFSELFAAGHRIWLRGDYLTAKEIFKLLQSENEQGPRVGIFLAHCMVMEGDFGGCSSVLHRDLPEIDFRDAASRLHDTFVFWKTGLFVDVKESLKSLAEEFSNLPSLSLMLADLLHTTGSDLQSMRFLRRAIRYDRPAGGVAMSAKAVLTEDNLE